MPQIQELPRLTIAEGSIDPDARIVRGEITPEEIDEFAQRLQSQEFYDTLAKWQVPRDCVDGRTKLLRGSCAAGGTFSVVMGDALTHSTYRKPGEKAPQHARRVYDHLGKLGHRASGHDDEHAHGPNCGCGAQDKLDAPDENPSILKYISEKGDNIRYVLESLRYTLTGEPLGIKIEDSLHNTIVTNAQTLRDESYATTGAELSEVTKDVGGNESVATLEGSHNEVVLIIDTREGVVLNRERLAKTFGDKLQAFYLNVPALKASAELVSNSPTEAYEKFIGSLYYNAATAAVLAGKSLRVIVL